MPNSIKYSTDSQTLALKKGNFYIGTGDVDKGPTSTTGYWNGITPLRGGYTIYLNKTSNGPTIYTPSNDSQLIDLTNKIAGTNYTTVNECFNYYVNQSDKMIFNQDYESIITNGLVFNVDASFIPSYPRNGTTWYNLSSTNNGSLINGPTFNSSNGGSIMFDGTNDYVNFNSLLNVSNIFTVNFWIKPTNKTRQSIVSNGYTYQQNKGFFVCCPGNNSTEFFISLGNDQKYTTSNIGALTTNVWQMVTARVNGSSEQMKLYVNGIETSYQIQMDGNVSLQYDAGVFTTGVRNGEITDTVNSEIGLLQIYNRSLSQSEILNNFRYGGQKAFTGCKTCKDIIDTFPQLAGYDGLYWVYPEGPTSSPYQVYCDMTTDGGGWMLVARSHPTTVNPNGKKWGWKGGSIGSINDFLQAYQLGWGEIWDGNATFTSYIFGNQRTNVDNSWGPFVYRVSSINYSTFFGSDTQQSYTYSTLKSNTAVYGTTDYPGMQGAIGYTTTGTNNDVYYMRDCCGYGGYGGYPTQMSTVYCGANFYYSGPWCGGSTNTGGVYDFGTYVSNGLTYGGTNQYMIMVK
jgi:hypothetical protein